MLQCWRFIDCLKRRCRTRLDFTAAQSQKTASPMATLVIWMNKSLQLWSVGRMNECGSTYSYSDTNPVSCVFQIPKTVTCLSVWICCNDAGSETTKGGKTGTGTFKRNTDGCSSTDSGPKCCFIFIKHAYRVLIFRLWWCDESGKQQTADRQR